MSEGADDEGGLLHIQELSLLYVHAADRLDGSGRVVLPVSQQTKHSMNKASRQNNAIQSKYKCVGVCTQTCFLVH